MKKSLKYCIVASLGMIAAGGVLVGIGMWNGGNVSYSVDFKEHKVKTRTYNSEDYMEKTLDVDRFSKLQLNVGATDVEIKKGTGYQIYYNVPKEEVPSIEVKEQELVISDKSQNSSHFSVDYMVNIGEHDGKNRDSIIITVPKDAEILEVGISVGNGNIQVKDMVCDTIDISGDNGDIEISNVTSDHANISSESGDISLHNVTLKDYHVVNEYGDLEVDNSVGEKAVFDCASVECKLKNLETNELYLTNEYGEVKVEGSTINTCEIDAASAEIKMEDCKGSVLNIETEYNDIVIEKSFWDQIQASCESGEVEIDLIGKLSEYDLDLTAECGEININGKDNGEKCKDISNREKRISVENEYGDVNVSVNEK